MNIPKSIFVVLDEIGLVIFSSTEKQICHDHINNMLDDDSIFEYAKTCIVREYILNGGTGCHQ